MEQHFRIALCMFFLIGYLQANPVPNNTGRTQDPPEQPLTFNKHDLALEFLRNIACENELFISPPKSQNHSHAALKCFIEGLVKATTVCTDGQDRLYMTLDALSPNSQPTNSSECGMWENDGSRVKFAVFVKNLENFVEALNSSKK